MADQPEYDVIILGGGVQGTWLLNLLRAHNYAAILLESTALGADQTGHSQVYLHAGYAYGQNGETFATNYFEWKDWLTDRLPRCGPTPSYFGYRDHVARERQHAIWNSLGLTDYKKVDTIPSVFDGGLVIAADRSPEISVESDWLMDELGRPHVGAIARVAKVRLIEPGNRVRVHVEFSDGSTNELRARAVVLAAGNANPLLLGALASAPKGPTYTIGEIQAQPRHGHVLVIRGSASDLPPFTGFVPQQNFLYVVGRKRDTDVVWLAANKHCFSGKYEPKERLPSLMNDLAEVFPTVWRNRQRLRFEVYEGKKSSLHDKFQEDVAPNDVAEIAEHVWIACPWRLTLAPRAARAFLNELRSRLGGASNSVSCPFAPQSVPVAKERWEKLNLKNWQDFTDEYDLAK